MDVLVALDVLEQNKANRLAKNPDRFSQDKLFGKFQTFSAGPGSIGKNEKNEIIFWIQP